MLGSAGERESPQRRERTGGRPSPRATNEKRREEAEAEAEEEEEKAEAEAEAEAG